MLIMDRGWDRHDWPPTRPIAARDLAWTEAKDMRELNLTGNSLPFLQEEGEWISSTLQRVRLSPPYQKAFLVSDLQCSPEGLV
jgi:hypothetical protein